MESFPSTPVTRYGITLLKEGIEPNITYISPDGDLIFYLNGGLAPFPGVTEGIVLEEGPGGLHPTFSHLDHKGARQAGVTHAGTVYDPAEITLDVIATARTPEGLRHVIRKWMAAWDPERQGTLTWVTPDGGEWWCHPRLFRAPTEKLARTMARSREQRFKWSIRNDDAFWRSHDSVGEFIMPFAQSTDEFDRDDVGTLGEFWQQYYSNPGYGVCETSNGIAKWTPNGNQANTVVNRWLGIDEIQTVTVHGGPTQWTLTWNSQTTSALSGTASASDVQTALEALAGISPGDVVVTGPAGGPYQVKFTGNLGKQDVPDLSGAVVSGGTNPYITVAKTRQGVPATTGGDIQIIKFRISSFHQWPWPTNARLDLWGRMSADGQTGIRLRIDADAISLHYVNGGTETLLKSRPLLLTPLWNETWTLMLGTSKDARHFKVKRGSWTALEYKDTKNITSIGSNYRGVGFGMRAGAGSTKQDTPPTIYSWSFGDNVAAVTRGSFKITNFGDQTAYPDLLVYGPGTFKFSDGPGREPTIEFGPLVEGQIALIKTKPGQRAVYDLTTDPVEQDLPGFQGFIKSLINLVFNNNVPPFMNWFQSLFGISPPQGNLYALLKGRWSRGVPPRSPGKPPETAEYAVEVTGGNADTKVIAALTPLRRWPE
ncbi:DUF7257 domain-containing protein [Mycolicibacterium phlei]|uniref:DUF7257 domain-containing protein n=1 Tax=Mycolicibacterium phlei TaxID=1771 RepID=UPI00031DA8D6|nr:hypothetical protein [Mycolicibacterium phlei]